MGAGAGGQRVRMVRKYVRALRLRAEGQIAQGHPVNPAANQSMAVGGLGTIG